MLHAKSPECGKNCSLANRDCQSQNTIKESKPGTPQPAKKTMQSVQQTNLIPVSSLHVSQHQPNITSSQQLETNSKQGQTQPNPVQHPMEWTVRKKSMIQSGQL